MFFQKVDCVVYVACRMTGRSKSQQIDRALMMCRILELFGLRAISPVLEEKVQYADEPLVQTTEDDLKKHWARDKQIMVEEAHVTLLDGGDEGSVGMGREYAFNRCTLWKPTITLWNNDRGITVAQFEDDAIFTDPFEAAAFIAENYGTRLKRWKWRSKMLLRTLPKFLYRQVRAWH